MGRWLPIWICVLKRHKPWKRGTCLIGKLNSQWGLSYTHTHTHCVHISHPVGNHLKYPKEKKPNYQVQTWFNLPDPQIYSRSAVKLLWAEQETRSDAEAKHIHMCVLLRLSLWCIPLGYFYYQPISENSRKTNDSFIHPLNLFRDWPHAAVVLPVLALKLSGHDCRTSEQRREIKAYSLTQTFTPGNKYVRMCEHVCGMGRVGEVT